MDMYISEQEEILSTIYENYESALDSYLNDAVKVIADSISTVNNGTSEINNTIKDKAEDVGYELSDKMEKVWEDEGKVLESGFSGVNKNVETGNGILSDIKTENDRLITAQKEALTTELHKLFEQEGIANQTVNDIRSNTDNINTNFNKANGLLETIASNTSVKDSGSGGSVGSNVNSSSTSSNGVNFKYQKNQYTGKLNTEYSIVDRLKSYNFDASFDSLKSYYSQMGFDGKYSGTAEQNIAMLEWMKKNYHGKGYASGGYNLDKQLAWTQENGEEYILRKSDGAILTPLAQGDSVLNSEATKNLWNMANNPSNFIMDNLKLRIPEFSRNQSGNNIEQNIAITIPLENVTDVNSFLREFQRNPKVEAVIKDVVASSMTGGNSLSKYRHKF